MSFFKSLKQYRFKPRLIPTIAVLLLLPLLISLGLWQLRRAEEKYIILTNLEQGSQAALITLDAKPEHFSPKDLARATITGHFDNQHYFLLDNKIEQHQVGYQVLSPFITTSGLRLLVNRGWIAPGDSRQQLPAIQPIDGEVTLSGVVAYPKKMFTLGETLETSNSWPKRLQTIDFVVINGILPDPIVNYVLLLDADAAHGFVLHWQFINMPPAKHTAYAWQWFSLALTLVILFVVTNTRRKM